MNAAVNRLNTKVGVLNKQVNTSENVMNYLGNGFGTVTSRTVKISQLGVEFTIPAVINDLTYSYSKTTTGFGNNQTLNIVTFSTKTLQKVDSNCTASSGDVLGSMATSQGIYAPSNASEAMALGTLVKQFPTFYVTYDRSYQATCASPTTLNGVIAGDLIDIQQPILQNAIKSTVKPIN